MSRPSILTMDNLGALIDLSDTFYIQSIGERVSSVVPVSVGVSLRVTPRIIDEGGRKSVQLTVDIEDGVIQEQTGQAGVSSSLPRVRRSTIGTQAVMGEHESLLIGGFNSEQNVSGRQGIPGLASLPVLGALFSKKTASVGKQERMFLITPRIVPAGGQPARAARLPQIPGLSSQPVQLPQPAQPAQAAVGTSTSAPPSQPLEQLLEQLQEQPLEQKFLEPNPLEQHSHQEAPLQREAPVPGPAGLRLDLELGGVPNPIPEPR